MRPISNDFSWSIDTFFNPFQFFSNPSFFRNFGRGIIRKKSHFSKIPEFHPENGIFHYGIYWYKKTAKIRSFIWSCLIIFLTFWAKTHIFCFWFSSKFCVEKILAIITIRCALQSAIMFNYNGFRICLLFSGDIFKKPSNFFQIVNSEFFEISWHFEF